MEYIGNNSAPETRRPPKTWLAESILATIFCCLPFGVVGIVYASGVESAFYAGRYDEAEHKSRLAKRWTLWGVAIAAVCVVLYLLGLLAVFLFTPNYS